VYGCQQVLIKADSETLAVLEYLCSEANKLTNCGLYYARQMFFKTGHYVSKAELDKKLKTNIHFKAMRSCCSQEALHSVYESFKSYRELKKKWDKGKLANKPKLPKYRKKGGMDVVTYPARWVKQIDNNIKFPLGKQVQVWFGIDSFELKIPSNLDFSNVKEIRILPRNGCFYAEYVYKCSNKKAKADTDNALGIDSGLNNWLTCVSTIGKSFIVDGRKVKSQNQWYNKCVANLKEGKPHAYWDWELANLAEKRNRQMRDAVNKSARFVINWCLANNVGTVVFGWNQRNKDGAKLGKKTNQEFVQIPTAKLKNRIAQLCEQYGLRFIETEESYTSKASFLDNDFLPTYGEKPERWKSSGKRIKRGEYDTNKKENINADCNGASNILKKVSTQLDLNLTKVSRAVLTLPQRYRLDDLSKSYRNRCEDACVQTAS